MLSRIIHRGTRYQTRRTDLHEKTGEQRPLHTCQQKIFILDCGTQRQFKPLHDRGELVSYLASELQRLVVEAVFLTPVFRMFALRRNVNRFCDVLSLSDRNIYMLKSLL